MPYVVVKANVDKEGILKDLTEINEKAAELQRISNRMMRRISVGEAATETDDEATESRGR